MKSINDQAKNKVNIVGKLLDTTFATGVTKSNNAPYERATATIRVNQTFGGREEVSEITVSMFATQYTNKGEINPAYKSIQGLKELKTVQNVGFEAADTVQFGYGTALSENNFVAKSGQLITSWQVRGSFVNKSTASSIAAFVVDLFIMDKRMEEDKNGEPTGRLIIKGGVVQYNGKLDVIEFIVEGPDKVEYIERNWEIHDTVTAKGYIRVNSVEEKTQMNNSWGEDVPEESTRKVRELIITTGDDQGKEEDFAYDPVEIKKAFNVRKAMIEQMLLDAKNHNTGNSTANTTSNKYTWE